MEIGIDRFLFSGANSPSGLGTNPVPDLLEEVETADKAGITAFALGEHHTAEFADSSPAVVLAAAAARTSRIRLSSGISILSVADPVKLMEDFSTLDLVSEGRAEIIAGRGAYQEAFALFGADASQYDALFKEKLDLLLRLRSGEPITWKGKFRPAIHGQTTFPRPIQKVLPVWVGATGTPATFALAGHLGLPLALAVLGGKLAQFRPLLDLYRRAGREAGHRSEQLRVALHAIGFVGQTDSQAHDDFFPGYNAIFGAMGRNAGMSALTRERFGSMTGPDQALMVGSVAAIAEKIRHADAVLGGLSRVCLQMSVGPLSAAMRLSTIALLGSVQEKVSSFGTNVANAKRTAE